MSRFAGRTVLITGGARGQGAEEGLRFAAEGAAVVLADVLDDDGEAAASAIRDAGGDGRYARLDITDESSWAEVLGGIERLDVLVNNAGILGTFTALVDTSVEDFRRTLDVNLVGTFLGLKHGGRKIGDGGGGAIVNISSISGMWGTPFAAPYVSSKWAVRGLTKAAAMELGRQHVRVNSVHPGGVRTPMTAAVGDDGSSDWYLRLPIPRMGEPGDIAAAVLFLASDEAAYITGTELVIDGGTLAGDLTLLPKARRPKPE